MTPPEVPNGGHHNPVFITVLPKERRAKQPYQLWIMIALVVMPFTQLLLGFPDTATVQAIPKNQAVAVNLTCLIAGLSGIYAAFVPERIIEIMGHRLDATWSRLYIELAGQAMLVTIWASYVATIFSVYPLWTRDGFTTGGLTLGGGLAFFLGIAGVHRSLQIAWTLRDAFRGNKRKNAAIVGSDTMENPTERQAGGG